MGLKVELAHPGWQVRRRGAHVAEVVLFQPLAAGRDAGKAARPPRKLEHLLGRASATIAVAEREEDLVVAGFLAEVVPGLRQLFGIRPAIVVAREARDVRQRAAAIDALPPEQVSRKGIAGLPVELARHEVVQAAPRQDARQRGRIAEYVGEPARTRSGAELIAEEGQAVDDLPDQRLTGRDVAVRLDPHPTGTLPPPRAHPALDFLVQVRIVLAGIGVQLRLAAREAVVGEALEEPAGRRERPRALADRLAQRPEPRHIDVRMTRQEDAAGPRVNADGVDTLGQFPPRRGYITGELSGRRGQIERQKRVLERGVEQPAAAFIWRVRTGLPDERQVIEGSLDASIHLDEGDLSQA